MLKVKDQLCYDERKIADKFNEFFTNVGPKLAKEIKKASKNFKTYLSPVKSELEYSELTQDEFEEAFKSLKRNKISGI